MSPKILLIVGCVLVIFTEQNQALECKEISGSLKQIDAGSGLVFGVNAHDNVFARFGDSWTQLPGTLKHVSVGPAGVWGADSDHNIFKLVAGDWVQVPGQLTQVDAGGDEFVAGVNHIDKVYCLERDFTMMYRSADSAAPWNEFLGALTYYSCGNDACWGVNENQDIFFREGVNPNECEGFDDWKNISGMLEMVEVGTDGSVYGVSGDGDVYRRDGVTSCEPSGTGWTLLSECGKSKHVSYDLGHLWVIGLDDKIYNCLV